VEAGNFSLYHHVQNSFKAHPASYPMDTGSSFWGGGTKQLEREVDHFPPFNAKVKNVHSPDISSWYGAELSRGTSLPVLLINSNTGLIICHKQ